MTIGNTAIRKCPHCHKLIGIYLIIVKRDRKTMMAIRRELSE
jgi:hypothetical protein